jgi:hypothetical protein
MADLASVRDNLAKVLTELDVLVKNSGGSVRSDASDPEIDKLQLNIQTGDDDLRGSSIAQVSFLIATDSKVGNTNYYPLNNGESWKNTLKQKYINTSDLKIGDYELGNSIPQGSIRAMNILLISDNTFPNSQDNWDMVYIQVWVHHANGDNDYHCLYPTDPSESSNYNNGNVLKRFTGSNPLWTISF